MTEIHTQDVVWDGHGLIRFFIHCVDIFVAMVADFMGNYWNNFAEIHKLGVLLGYPRIDYILITVLPWWQFQNLTHATNLPARISIDFDITAAEHIRAHIYCNSFFFKFFSRMTCKRTFHFFMPFLLPK